jgi:hypothetical protein
VFNIWFQSPELPLLFLTGCICSLYLAWNARPVALCALVGNPYISFGIRHFFRTHLFAGEALLGIVFFVRNAIFIFVSLKSLVISFVSFPYYVRIFHFIV